MKILLIGGNGLIGHAVQALLKDKNGAYSVIDKKDLNLEAPSSIDTCLNKHQPDLIISSAAYSDVKSAENEPSRCFRINRDAIAHLAACCHERHIILIHISSYRVFDGRKTEAYTEQDVPNPSGVLATSYWQTEQQIKERCPRHIILRLSWLISHQSPNFLKNLLDQITEEPEVTVLSDQQGCPTTAEDVARVIVAIIQQLNCGAESWGTYHYAGAEPLSANHFAELVIAEASRYHSLKICKLHLSKLNDSGDIQTPANATLSCKKILSTFGVHNKSWRNSLTQIVESYFDQ